MNKNNNKANQNNMVVNYNMTAEHQLKCFKLRTTAPMYAPKMKPQHYSKLPTYQWAKNIYVDENDQAVPYNYNLLQENKIFTVYLKLIQSELEVVVGIYILNLIH